MRKTPCFLTESRAFFVKGAKLPAVWAVSSSDARYAPPAHKIAHVRSAAHAGMGNACLGHLGVGQASSDRADGSLRRRFKAAGFGQAPHLPQRRVLRQPFDFLPRAHGPLQREHRTSESADALRGAPAPPREQALQEAQGRRPRRVVQVERFRDALPARSHPHQR